MKASDVAIAAAVIVIWGVNFWFMKIALADIQPMLLGALRFVFLLLPALFVLPRPNVAWWWLILYGLSISFGQFGLMFMALWQGMPTGLAALLHQGQVFFSVILAMICLREPVQRQHFIAMLIAMLGLLFIGVGQYHGVMPLLGLWLVLASALMWACGNMVVKKIGKVNPLSLVVWGNVVTLPAFALTAWWQYGTAGVAEQIAAMRWQTWAAVLYLAYVAGLLGYAGWGVLLSRYPAGKMTPLALLVPVIALLVAYFGLNEPLNAWHWAGVWTVMAALVLHVFGARLLRTKNR
ncbi:MAG: EamA family transporter [Neisseria sp.]|nr:EamA family transporter [Neisseria sp.]